MSRPVSRFALVAVATCALASCASAGLNQQDDVFRESGPEEVYLTVLNNDQRAATIYAYWSGVKERVGVISPAKRETFTMPWRHELVRISYEFVGRRALPGNDYVDGFTSEPIEVWRGDHLDLVIQAQN